MLLQTENSEKRNFQRVPVQVRGRFMRADRTEHTCDVTDMSPGDVFVRSRAVCDPGERVIAYLDLVGRIEGRVTRSSDEGFSAEIIASDRKREKLAAQLTWLVNKHELNLPEDRRHERAVVKAAATSVVELEDGRKYPCRLIDLSLSGAAVGLESKPPLGTSIRLGIKPGKVVRHFEDGVAIEFLTLQSHESLRDAFADAIV
jgi:PilZ domain